jgi:hypothetical protein
LCRKIVASLARLSHPVNELVGRPLRNQQAHIYHRFEVPLQGPAIDFMFVNTPDGVAILERRVAAVDELLGKYHVIQPTDYIILKMMAIANNPDRSVKDEADISAFIKLCQNRLLPDYFEPLDKARIYLFSDRFGQRELI